MKNFDVPTRSSVPGFTAIHDSEWLELSGWGPQVPGTYAGFAGYPPPITGLLATTFVNATELDQSRPAAAPADDACRTRVIARMTAPTRAFTEDRDMADLPIFASFRPRPPTRDASPESLERAYRQKEAILLDRGARNDEEDNAPDGGPDRRERLADQINELADHVPGGDLLVDADARVKDAFVRRAQPVEAVHHTGRHDRFGRAIERADRAQDVGHAVNMTHDVLFDEQPASARLGEHRCDPVERRQRVKRARPLAGGRALDRPVCS